MLRRVLILVAVLVSASLPAAARARTGDAPAPLLRAARLRQGGGGPAAEAEASFALDLGFNAVWVDGAWAARWMAGDAPAGPEVDPSFKRLARGVAARGARVIVALRPVAESRGTFAFDDAAGSGRVVEAARKLTGIPGVRDLVLAFDDAPSSLTELRDALRFGKCAAPAHLELARRVRTALRHGARLWLAAAAVSDADLDGGDPAYARALLDGLAGLPRDVGLVWTGPERVPAAISAGSLRAARERFGGRDLLFYDASLDDFDPGDEVTAAPLGALSGRDAAALAEVAGVVISPARAPGIARLTLRTAADFLRAPSAYAPDSSLAAARARLAGPTGPAAEALRVQTLEWGGPPGNRNWQPWARSAPGALASRVEDPGFVAEFAWTVDRYPSRIAAMASMTDAAFRDGLTRLMERRLAIARLIPMAAEYRERRRAGRADASETLSRIAAERRRTANPDARRVLDRFLEAAEVPITP